MSGISPDVPSGVRLSRDYYGFIHVSSEEKQDQDFTTSLKPEASPPSKITPQSSSWKILKLIQFLGSLIRELWRGEPYVVDQHLFEDIILSSTRRSIAGASSSEVFSYLVRFLKREPGIPRNLIDEVEQCAGWAKQFEMVEQQPLLQERREQLGKIAQDLAEKISRLNEGEGCLIPGGVFQSGNSAYALYRFTKTGENYEFQILSRDPSLTKGDFLPLAGKEKIEIGTAFEKLTRNEVTDELWLQALISLQFAQMDEAKEIPLSSNSLSQLLTHFADRKKLPAAEEKRHFHTQRQRLSRIQNIWSFVQDSLPETLNSKEEKARRKLRLSLDALYGYYQGMINKKEHSALEKGYLTAGVDRLTQDVLMLYRKGTISEPEFETIAAEIDVIKNWLAAKNLIETAPPPLNVRWPPAVNFSLKRRSIEVSSPQQVELKSVEQEKPSKPPVRTTEEKVEPVPFSGDPKTVYKKTQLEPFDVTSKNVLKFLEEFKVNADQHIQDDPIDFQHLLCEFIFQLPFDFPEERGGSSMDKLWIKLSEDDRSNASKVLAELGTKLTEASLKTNTCLPDRVLALTKLICIGEYLARLNESKTGMTDKFNFKDIELFFDHLWMGYNASRSFYSLRNPAEYQACKDLKNYFRLDEGGRKDIIAHIQKQGLPIPPEISHLTDLEANIKKMMGAADKNSSKGSLASLTTADKMSAWGKPIQNLFLAGAAYSVHVAQGTDQDAREYHSSIGNPWMTQEAIIDDPKRVLNRAWEKWKDDLKNADVEKPILPKEISVEELRQLLLSMDNATAIWNLLGLIDTNPHLLLINDICSLVENLFLRRPILLHALGNDPQLLPFIGGFFDRHIKAFKKQQHILPALFLVHLSHSLQSVLLEDKEYKSQAKKLPQYSNFVLELMLSSLLEDSPVKTHRHALLAEYLFLFKNRERLNQNDIKNLIIFNVLLENSQIQHEFYDPVFIDQVRKNVRTWGPQIEKALADSPEMLQHVLDRVCELQKVPLSKTPWKGKFPIFSRDDIEINVLLGSVVRLQEAENRAYLLPEILNSTLFRKLFPDFTVEQPRLAKAQGENIYGFTDKSGNENRIEYQNQELRVFRKSRDNRWLQYLSKEKFEELLPKEEVLPKCLLKGNLFIDPSVESEYDITTYSDEGIPGFRLTFKRDARGINVIETTDLRLGNERHQGMEARLLDESQPLLAQLTKFDSKDQIICWVKEGNLQEVEFIRYGLTFSCEQGRLVCISEPYKGSQVELNPSLKETKGLPAYLVLKNPSIGSTKILVPSCEGHYYYHYHRQLPKPPEFRQWLIALLTRQKIPVPEVPKKVYEWSLGHSSAEQLRYYEWSLSTEGDLNLSTISHDAYADMLLYCLQSCQTGDQEALHRALKCIRGLGRTSWKAIPEKDVIRLVQDFTKFALKPNDIVNTPDPETAALTLRLLFEMKNTLPDKLMRMTDEAISLLAPVYFSHGKRIDLNACLTLQQEKACLEILKKFNPEYYADHAAQLSIESGEEQILPMNIYSRRFFSANPPLASLKPLGSTILKGYKRSAADGPAENLFLERDPEKIMRNFRSVYQTAEESPESASFKSMQLTLKVLSRRSENSEDYLEKFIQCLTAIFDIRANNPEVELPQLPELSYPDESKIDVEDFLRNWEIKKEYDAIKLESDKKFDQFIDDLEKVIKQNYSGLVNRFSEPFPQDEVDKRNLEVKIQKKPFDYLTADELTEALQAAAPEKKNYALYHQEADQCLFKSSDIAELFVPEDISLPFETLKLSELEKSEEPAVQKAATTLQDELMAYQDEITENKVKHQKIKDKASLDIIKDSLKAKAKAFKQEKKVKKDAILQHIAPSQAVLEKFERTVGYQKSVTWDELKLAFLQQDLDSLQNRLGNHVDIQELKSKLRNYFKEEVGSKYAEFVLRNIEDYDSDNLVKSAVAGTAVFNLLTRSRSFDAAQFPEMLALESYLGFMMNEEQISMVSDFLNDNASVIRGITGIGKSTVIVILAALMKADGHNLVTVKFLDPLFRENLGRFEKVLGSAFKKRVTPLLFDMKTPLVIKKNVNGKEESESVFKSMYQKATLTVLEKGVLVTNRRSMPLLEAKFIALLDRLSHLPKGEYVDPMDMEHLEYLGKLLLLMRERQECFYDEHDKILAPRDEIHLRLGHPKETPSFMWETNLKVFDELQKTGALDLKQNIQAELTPEKRKEILQTTAKALAGKWKRRLEAKLKARVEFASEKKHEDVLKKIEKGVEDYFTGSSEEILPELEERCTKEELDEIALTKDMLLIFLPLTLSKEGNKRYIRSSDGIHVIPCDYTDQPREGSEFEEVRERIPYFIQYYYQTGVSYDFLKKWIDDLKAGAFQEIERKTLESISQTTSEKLFKSYFPEESLGNLFEADISRLHAKVKNNPKLIRKFLKVLLPKLKMSDRKISIDAHNQVSMSKATCGTSATEGCKEGLHRQFHVKKDEKHLNAKMLSRLMRRTEQQNVLTYNPAQPDKIIPELKKEDPDLQVVIDGAGALWGISPQETAKQLLNNQPEGSSTEAVGYFDKSGRVVLEGNQHALLNQRGQIFSNAQARGADVKLDVNKKAILLANGRTPLEEINQNEGRLRNEDQKMRLAVPNTGKISSTNDLIKESFMVQNLENSDNVCRSKKQEIRDIPRSDMINQLLENVVRQDFDTAFDQFLKFENAQLLVSQRGQDWSKPGSYYKQNKHIQKKESLPEDILNGKKGDYEILAKKLGLGKATEDFKGIDYTSFAQSMPSFVFDFEKFELGVEVEVETELQVQTESEVSVELQAETEVTVQPQEEIPYYLKWRSHEEPTYRVHSFREQLHPAYDEDLIFSENYLPIYRNSWAPLVYHRQAHDPRQNRLHYVYFGEGRALALDLIDTREIMSPRTGIPLSPIPDSAQKTLIFQNNIWIYDTKLNRFINWEKENKISKKKQKILEKPIPEQTRWIAQMRFEDGQFDGYSSDEWISLEKWLKNWHNPVELEDYFKNQVLRNRPEDREKYNFSPLKALFDKILRRKK